MSFHINSDKEKIRGVNPKLIGDNEVTIRSGTGSGEKEILRAQLDSATNLPRVGINRTGQRVNNIDIDTAGSGYTDGTYYAAVFGDGTNQGTSSGAVIRITVTSGSIQSFGLTAGTDTTIESAGAGYTFGTVNLGNDFIFSDSSLSSSTTLGSGTGGAIEVIISPKDGHGNDAVAELGGHFVMLATTLTQAEGDDFTTANDFRSVGIVVDPTNFGTSTVATATTRRQTYIVKLDTSSGTFEADERISKAKREGVLQSSRPISETGPSTVKILRCLMLSFKQGAASGSTIRISG